MTEPTKKPPMQIVIPPENQAKDTRAAATSAEAAAKIRAAVAGAAGSTEASRPLSKPEPAATGTGVPKTVDPATWSARGFVLAGVLMLVLLIGGLGSWAVFTHIAGAIIASGQIEVDRNRQVVQHLDGGVVAEILVDEGDTVATDQVLIRLDGTLLRSDLTVTENQYFELLARRGRLEAERDDEPEITFDDELMATAALRPEVAELVDGQERLFRARLESMSREIDQLGKRRIQIASQIEGITAQQRAMESQLDYLRDELRDQTDLMDKGLAQKSRVLALQREDARLSGEVGELVASRAEAEGRITELEIEEIKLGSHRREEAITTLRDLQYKELELGEQRRALQERLSRLDIKSPVAGVVYGLQVFTERSVVRAAEPVLYVIPQDRPLIIAAKVDPIHIDQVFPGQPVTLRFPTFSSRTTPELDGHVNMVSPDAFTDERHGTSYYRVELEATESELHRLPPNVKLLPGMPVEAHLKTDERTPLAYLLKPFTDYFSKAFVES